MFSRIDILIIVCFNAIITTHSEEYFKATKMECVPSPKYFANHSCRLKAVNRYKTLAFMETYIQDILRNVSVNLSMHIRNDANIFKPFLVNITQNVCWYLNRRAWGPYLNIFMKTLTKFSNVNHSCPFTGPIIVKNLFLDRNLIPVAFPRGVYKIEFKFYEGYPLDFIGTVAYYVEILETKHQKN